MISGRPVGRLQSNLFRNSGTQDGNKGRHGLRSFDGNDRKRHSRAAGAWRTRRRADHGRRALSGLIERAGRRGPRASIWCARPLDRRQGPARRSRTFLRSTICAKALLDARSVAYSDSASGVYVETQLFKRLGIEEQMKGKGADDPATPVAESLQGARPGSAFSNWADCCRSQASISSDPFRLKCRKMRPSRQP